VAFGYIREVVFEPNAQAPERVQLWGTFSVAAREEGSYQIPEDGYLYFTLPEKDADKARAEWRELATWPKDRIAALSRRGPENIQVNGRLTPTQTEVRVWTEAEQQPRPGKYEAAGLASDRDGEGIRLLLEAPKGAVRHYAVVDRIEELPDAKTPKEVRVWGTFTLEGNPAERGYIYFTVDTQKDWDEASRQWHSAAGSGRPVAFYTKIGAQPLEVRGAGEAAGQPDNASVLGRVMPVRPDSWYMPIRRLIGSKCGGPCY
jgi:hypothetical protein